LRKATGRGKNRKAGGLVTLQLPDQNETVESAEVSHPEACHLHASVVTEDFFGYLSGIRSYFVRQLFLFCYFLV